MNLDSIVNKIQSYNNILTNAQYPHTTSGSIKPWAVRHVHADGTAIEVRSSEWTFYDAENTEVATGNTAESLRQYLAGK